MANAKCGRQKNMAEEIALVVHDAVRREIRKYFIKGSCIATTRIVVDLSEHFGFEAVPVHVDMTTWNPAWVNAILRGEKPPYQLGDEAVHRWMDERGAWNVTTQGASQDEPVRHLIGLYSRAFLCDRCLHRPM